MTAHVPMARVPFAPLDNPRLQHLASAKNRQNGFSVLKSVLNGKNSLNPTKSVSSSKRPLETTIFDEFDSENVDPTLFSSPSKKSKNGSDSEKPFTFSMSVKSSMPPPPSRLSTPVRANMSSPRTPSTAPAGRSPPRKSTGLLKSRRTSAPFTRIDPPFASRVSTALPFSLNEALSGTLSQPSVRSAGATIQESMPKTWFFDIHEDTPEEEAANLMEHSTLTLDLSSDDESNRKQKDDRGKENTPPEGYDAPTASRPASIFAPSIATAVKKTDIVRKKIAADSMDDGERSPLTDLETEPFIPEGLTKDAHVIVDASAATASKLDLKELFAAPVPFTAGESSKKPETIKDVPEVKLPEEITVWEDSSSTPSKSGPEAIIAS